MVTWLNAGFEMRYRLIGGLTIRFAASWDHGDHALLLSPWPESLLAFEPVWWRLAKGTQLVAVDLPGFGHSHGLLPGRPLRRVASLPASSYWPSPVPDGQLGRRSHCGCRDTGL